MSRFNPTVRDDGKSGRRTLTAAGSASLRAAAADRQVGQNDYHASRTGASRRSFSFIFGSLNAQRSLKWKERFRELLRLSLLVLFSSVSWDAQNQRYNSRSPAIGFSRAKMFASVGLPKTQSKSH